MAMLLYSKHSEALTANTTGMVQLAESSRHGQEMLISLTSANKRDSEIMRLIAVVTLIYLPSSLITVGTLTAHFVNLEANETKGRIQHGICVSASHKSDCKHKSNNHAGNCLCIYLCSFN